MKAVLLKASMPFFFLLLANAAYAQPDIWTWIKGDSTYGAPGYYGTQGVSSPLYNPMGRAIAANWKDNTGNMWMYGGVTQDFGSSYYLSDLWKYNPTTNIWTWMKGDSGFQHHPVYGTKGVAGAANTPGDRKDPAHWQDNAGNLWMYAGNGCASNGCAAPTNDLWKYDIATNRWTYVSGDTLCWQSGNVGTQGVPAAINMPASRTAPQGWCDGAGNFWVFSGSSSYPGLWPTTDMWRYNPSTNVWTWMKGDPIGQAAPNYGVKGVASATNVPPARSHAATWTDAAGNLWMYGGLRFNAYFSDMWMFNPSTNQWTWVSGDSSTNHGVTYGMQGVAAQTNSPGGRINASYWKDDAVGDLWLFGGTDYEFSGGRHFKDVWRYSIASGMWTWFGGDTTYGMAVYNTMGVPSYSNYMGTRTGDMAWVDNASGKLYVSNGEDNWFGVYLNDVWTYEPPTPFPFAISPLHLLSFTANLQNNTTHLRWTSENEINFDRYEIERSTNGSEFNKIATVRGANAHEYSHADDVRGLLPAVHLLYYRLKMVDKDGTFTYSPVRIVSNSGSFTVTVRPNPVKDKLQVLIESEKKVTLQAQLVTQDGMVLLTTTWNVSEGSTVQHINTSTLQSGSYFIKLSSLHLQGAGGQQHVMKFEKL